MKPPGGGFMILWAHLDLNQGPLPYQGSALTGLSYGPEGAVSVDEVPFNGTPG